LAARAEALAALAAGPCCARRRPFGAGEPAEPTAPTLLPSSQCSRPFTLGSQKPAPRSIAPQKPWEDSSTSLRRQRGRGLSRSLGCEGGWVGGQVLKGREGQRGAVQEGCVSGEGVQGPHKGFPTAQRPAHCPAAHPLPSGPPYAQRPTHCPAARPLPSGPPTIPRWRLS
jgi:hypothetical protein